MHTIKESKTIFIGLTPKQRVTGKRKENLY